MPRKSRFLRNLAVSPKRTSSPPGPPSPTFSDATHASAMNFGADGPEKIITRADLKVSLQSYDEFMNATANYRAALLHMSKVTFAFADALEKCSGLKGPSYESCTRLQAASGLHHLIGNHWHVLAETLDRSFEKPLRQHLDTYRTIVNERSASYEKALREKSEIIRQTEMSNMNKKQRNLQSFREALTVLQRQVDDLDVLKAQHYQQIMDHEEEVWDVVQGKVCVVVRSSMDVFDRFTSKASDSILEAMLQSVPDPFDSYGPPQAEDQIFTILPPLAVMANAPSPSPSPLAITPPRPSDISPLVSNSSWAPNGGFFANTTSEWAASVSPSSTPPRSSSPPSVLRRRQSHPPAIHHARKSESKLRSVLSVIDEMHVRHPSDPDDASPSEAETLQPNINGTPLESDTNWGTPPYGESPYPSVTDSSISTPVQTTLAATLREITPTNIGELDSSRIPQSPQPDEAPHLSHV